MNTPIMPDLAALSGLCTWFLARLLNTLAEQAGWSRGRRAWVARTAPLIGGGLGYALGAVLYGMDWRGVLHGFVGGMCAVWAHQARPRTDEGLGLGRKDEGGAR